MIEHTGSLGRRAVPHFKTCLSLYIYIYYENNKPNYEKFAFKVALYISTSITVA
jgi:hypothetical protein